LAHLIDPNLLYNDFIYETSKSPGLREHFQNYSTSVLDKTGPGDGRLAVDLGSNDGLLLSYFQKGGFRVLGVDPAVNIAAQATQSGIDTIAAYFQPDLAEDIKSEHGTAHLITANNVVANVDDLDEFVDAVRMLLHRDGLFVFETGYLLDLVRNCVFDNIYHEHISYLAVIPLQAYFHRHGLVLTDVEHVSTKGGSIRGYVQRKGKPSVAVQ